MAFADLVARADRAARDRLGGEEVTYQPQLGAPVDVVGMFDEQYVLSKGSSEAGVEATVPAVFLDREQFARLPTDPEEDEPTVTIRGVDYRVVEREGPDGMGGIVLVLRRLG